MALQWADDFGRYGVGADSTEFMLDGLPYANIGTGGSGGRAEASPDPNDTVRAFLIGFDGSNWQRDFRIALPNVVSNTVGILFRAWLSALPATDGQRPALVGVQRGDAEYMAYLQVEQNGSLTVVGRVGGSLVEIADTVNPVVQPNSFNHYEMVHNALLGEGQIYVNGILRLSYTGVDAAVDAEIINFSYRSSVTIGPRIWIKDLVIWDSSGSNNNSVMGTVVVRRLRPNGDDTLGGWSPSTGSTGFNLLNKTTPDDSTFLSGDDTPPDPMIYNLENLPPDITSVRALVPVVRMRKIDGGDANVQTALSPDGTNWDNGADRPITSAFSYYFDVSELDPATGLPWNPIGVDAALLRIDRTI